MLIAVDKFSALELCDRGEYKAAGELAGLSVGEWPDRGSQGDSEHAETLLVAGIITSTLGGIQQTGRHAIAREMLTESLRLFPSLETKSWLAWADYWAGDISGAIALSETLIDKPLDTKTLFRVRMLRAAVYWDQGLPERSLAELAEMETVYEECGPLAKGKFHNQRAVILRQKRETDRAIVDYDAAICFFRQAGNLRWQAVAANNLAGVYLETKQYNQAHQYAESARELFRRVGDKTYEAKALDQSALIYLAADRFSEALEANAHSLVLVDQGEIVNECLATGAKIKREIAISEKPEDAKMSARSPSPITVTNQNKIMEPLELVTQILQNQPDNAAVLLDLILLARRSKRDVENEAKLDEVEEVLYAKTPDCELHRDEYRRSRLPIFDS